MRNNQAYVYILILNYNYSKDTLELYDQLRKIDYNNKFILVIDNNSKDMSQQKLKKNIPKRNLLINKKNLGYAGGNNIGIVKAIKNGADYVWILNPDIRVKKNTLKILIEHITKKEKIAVIGPRICERNNNELIYSDGGILHIENGFQTKHLNNKKNIKNIDNKIKFQEVDYVNGSCFLINLACIDFVGFLREDFFLYFEETEWCLRAQKLGWKSLVVYETICFHLSSNKNFRYYYYMTRNRIYLSVLLKTNIFKTIKFEMVTIRSMVLRLQLKIAVFKACGLVSIIFKLPYNYFVHIRNNRAWHRRIT